jgi:hypothetical protein
MSHNDPILITYDVQGWAWHRRAKGIEQYSPYPIIIQPGTPYATREWTKHPGLWSSCYRQVIWQEWWTAPPGTWIVVANEGCMYNYDPKHPNFCHRTASKHKNLKAAKRVFPQAHGIICINPKCIDFCRSLNKNSHFLYTGVDTDFWCSFDNLNQVDVSQAVIDGQDYKPNETDKALSDGCEWIGWCGKPSTPEKWSPKGYQEVLLPFMSFMGPSNYSLFNFRVNTKSVGVGQVLNEESMRIWYNNLDYFLCTSCSEGTPNTVLEAASCGVPIVSTNVGIVSHIHPNDRPAVGLVPTYSCNQSAQLTLDILKDIFGHPSRRSEVHEHSKFVTDRVRQKFSWKNLAPHWTQLVLRS